jgi:cytochrome c553
MKNLFSYILFIFTIVFLFGLTFSIAQDSGSEGKKVFIDKKCGTCHSVQVEGLESKKKDAVDLSSVGEERTAEFLKLYLTKAEKIEDAEHKTAFKGTDKELDELTKWLASLKEETK